MARAQRMSRGVVSAGTALLVLAALATPGAASPDFGDKPGCPGEDFIGKLIGWIGQYSLWACFASVVFGFGYWAWSKSQGGGYGMAAGQRYIFAGFAGIAGIALAAAVASTLWDAASAGS